MRIYDAATNSMRQVGEGGLSRSGLNGDFNNIAPRVGASWDLTGQGTWLLRGGYGLFYDSGTLIENSALYFNEPYWALQLFFPSETAPIFLNNPFPADGGFTPTPAVNTLDPNFRTAYFRIGSVALERVRQHDDHGALRHVALAATSCASATSIRQCPGLAISTRVARLRASATSCSSSRRRRRAITACN